jgi:hypothetical protein
MGMGNALTSGFAAIHTYIISVWGILFIDMHLNLLNGDKDICLLGTTHIKPSLDMALGDN